MSLFECNNRGQLKNSDISGTLSGTLHIENAVLVYSTWMWRWRQRYQGSLIDSRYSVLVTKYWWGISQHFWDNSPYYCIWNHYKFLHNKNVDFIYYHWDTICDTFLDRFSHFHGKRLVNPCNCIIFNAQSCINSSHLVPLCSAPNIFKKTGEKKSFSL